VTKKTKQKKTRAWRRALHSRLTVPLFTGTATLVENVFVALEPETGCEDCLMVVISALSILIFAPWRSAEGAWMKTETAAKTV